jgi:hypothetical protein
MEGQAFAAGTVPNYGPAATLRYNRVSGGTPGQEWISPFISTGGVTITNTGIIILNAAKVFGLSSPLIIDIGAKLDTNNFGLTFGGNLRITEHLQQEAPLLLLPIQWLRKPLPVLRQQGWFP